MSALKQDLVSAFRQILRRPGDTAVIVLVLSLGFGANAAVFSVANAVLLRPLPVEDPSRLVRAAARRRDAAGLLAARPPGCARRPRHRAALRVNGPRLRRSPP